MLNGLGGDDLILGQTGDDVTVTFTPSGNIDLGAGPGEPITVTFTPDGDLSYEFCAEIAPDANPDDVITPEVESDDPNVGASAPPIVIDILPESDTDPFLIFERLDGDVMPGFTAGDDVVDATGRPGPTSFHVEGFATGRDMIRSFGRTDILIVD